MLRIGRFLAGGAKLLPLPPRPALLRVAEGQAPDDFGLQFAFNRWANARMLDVRRKLTPEQYAAEPVPCWSSVRATVATSRSSPDASSAMTESARDSTPSNFPRWVGSLGPRLDLALVEQEYCVGPQHREG
jgi:hypothetical protein